MASRVYQLVSTSTTLGSAIVYLEAVQDCTIYALDWNVGFAGAAATDTILHLELSFSQTYAYATHDALGMLSAITIGQEFESAIGRNKLQFGKFVPGLRIPWARSERLYYNGLYSGDAPVTCFTRVLLYTA